MITFLKNKLLLLVSFFYLIFAEVSLAQGEPTELVNPTSFGSIDALLSAILSFVVRIGGPIVTIAIIYTGFQFVMARGNTTKLEDARRALWYVVIGAAIVLGAQVLKTVITGTVEEIGR